MNIVITGGCGFLGQHLINELQKEHTLTILDMHTKDIPGVCVINADIVHDDLREHFSNTDLVIHAAGLVRFGRGDKDALHAVNVEGTRNILKASKHVPWFIHISSVAALGYSNDKNILVDEDYQFDWTQARSKHYMTSKKRADELINRDAVIIYPGLIYGPGDTNNTSKLINAIRNQQIPFNMPGGTTLIDVRDVARGIKTVIDQRKQRGRYILTYHNIPYKTINETIARNVGVQAPARTINPLLALPVNAISGIIETLTKGKLTQDLLHSGFLWRYFDNRKARNELGWKPQLSLDQTIKDSLNWMKEHGLEE